MKKIIQILFLLLISFELMSAPLKSNMILHLIRNEMIDHQDFYFSELENSPKLKSLNQTFFIKRINEIKEELNNPSIPLSSIKEKLIKQVLDEESQKLWEFNRILQKMSADKLDQFFELSLKRGIYDPNLSIEYQQAFNGQEKRLVILQMVRSDLASIKSATVKKLGKMSRNALTNELKSTLNLLQIKGDGWKIALIVVATLAITGLMCWGIVSASKKYYEERKKILDDEYDDKENDLQNDYASKEALIKAEYKERARLRDEGYVMSICGTTTSHKESLCQFDHLTHSGAEICTIRCLKNHSTGDELMHETVCTSAFIPSNCFQMNPYDRGLSDGATDGYNDGYDLAYNRAYDDVYHNAYTSAYDTAYPGGYNAGRNDGQTDGYNDGYDDGYNRSYDNSYSQAYNGGYDRGYNDGFSDGLNQSSYSSSLSSSSNDAVDVGFSSGYSAGYAYANMLLTI